MALQTYSNKILENERSWNSMPNIPESIVINNITINLVGLPIVGKIGYLIRAVFEYKGFYCEFQRQFYDLKKTDNVPEKFIVELKQFVTQTKKECKKCYHINK